MLLLLACAAPQTATPPQLVYALDLIRHGDRYPAEALPNTDTAWLTAPDGSSRLGTLTDAGVRRAQALGHTFRTRYVTDAKLLPATMDRARIHVLATDVGRSQISACLAVSRVYPDAGWDCSTAAKAAALLDEGSKRIREGVIPRTGKPEFATAMAARVPEFSTPGWAEVVARETPVLPDIAACIGSALPGVLDLRGPADGLRTWRENGQPLPACTLPPACKPGTCADDVIAAGDLGVAAIYGDEPLMQQFAAPMLALIQAEIDAGLKGGRVWTLIGAHDVSLLWLLTLFGVPQTSPPPYSADLNLSIYRDEGKDCLIVSYQGVRVRPTHELFGLGECGWAPSPTTSGTAWRPGVASRSNRSEEGVERADGAVVGDGV